MAGGETIAVLGAGGMMGLPMARNLARAGFAVRAWNRTPAKAEPLREDGAEVFDSAAEAVQGAGVILTMLSDADAVLGTVEGVLDAAGDRTIWLQMSTIGEAATERCAKLADEHGVTFVDAPVLGTRQPAEQGQLTVLASGPEGILDRLQPIFDAVGQRTIWVGEAGGGTRLKLVTNSWVVTVTEGAAETIALAEGLGVDPKLFLEAIEGGALDLPYLRIKGTAILERNFEPSFKLRLAAKDAALVEESCQRHGLDLPMLRAIRARLAEGVPEHGDEDMAATYLTSAPARAAT